MPQRGQADNSVVKSVLSVLLLFGVAYLAVLGLIRHQQVSERKEQNEYWEAVITQLDERLDMSTHEIDHVNKRVVGSINSVQSPCLVHITFKTVEASHGHLQFWTDTPVSLQLTNRDEAQAYVENECQRLN